MLHYMRRYMTGAPLREVIERALADVAEQGFDVLAESPSPDWSLPRPFEVAAALNRLPPARFQPLR